MGEARSLWGAELPRPEVEIQEKMVRENGERERRRKTARDGKGMEIDLS